MIFSFWKLFSEFFFPSAKQRKRRVAIFGVFVVFCSLGQLRRERNPCFVIDCHRSIGIGVVEAQKAKLEKEKNRLFQASTAREGSSAGAPPPPPPFPGLGSASSIS